MGWYSDKDKRLFYFPYPIFWKLSLSWEFFFTWTWSVPASRELSFVQSSIPARYTSQCYFVYSYHLIWNLISQLEARRHSGTLLIWYHITSVHTAGSQCEIKSTTNAPCAPPPPMFPIFNKFSFNFYPFICFLNFRTKFIFSIYHLFLVL